MTTDLPELITKYEKLCNQNYAQSREAKGLRKAIENKLAYRGLEYCAHNMACFGSKRYARYKNPTLDRPVTCREYREAMRKWEERKGPEGEMFDFQRVEFK